MQDTKGLLDQIKHHDQLAMTVNENCTIVLPQEALQKLLQPHKLTYFYFVFMDQGSETVKIDLQDVKIADGQVAFGLPNQVFFHGTHSETNQHYKIGFDENTLALLPSAYPFLVNPLQSHSITFEPDAKGRVKAILSILFQLLHASAKPISADIILAHLNSLLTEFNSAYFEKENHGALLSTKLSKYVEFKLAVETHLTEQPDMTTLAEQLGMTTNSLYAVVKAYSGLSPKEWMTNRLIQEAQRQLQYSTHSVKELAYALGFNDPAYFSRLFKKRTGKSVSTFMTDLHNLSSK